MYLGLGLGLPRALNIGAPSTPAGDIAFGALTPIGGGAAATAIPNGTYGEFTVSGGEISPNTSPLTVGDATVGDITVSVVADAVTVSGVSELQDVVDETVASAADTCYLRPGDYDTSTLTFSSQRSGITYRSADTSSRAAFKTTTSNFLWDLNSGGAKSNIAFRELYWEKPHLSVEGGFWTVINASGANAYTFFLADSANCNGLTCFDCEFNGKLLTVQEGMRAATVDALMVTQSADLSNVTFEECIVRNMQTGIKVGIDTVTIKNCDFLDLQGDFAAMRPGLQNFTVVGNFFDPIAADNTGFHADFIQAQPDPDGSDPSPGDQGPIEDFECYGNIICPSGPLWGQANPNASNLTTVSITGTSLTATVANNHGFENRINGDQASLVTITLPDPTTVPGAQFCFRNVNADGGVSFTLQGSATWTGGTPEITSTNAGATFVSDGTSVWKQLQPGYRNWWMVRDADFTFSNLEEENFVTILRADTENVTATLPLNGSGNYSVTCENDTFSPKVVTQGGNTINYHGSTVTEVTHYPGLAINYQGDGAGGWTISEGIGASQVLFSNNAVGPVYSRWKAWGNIAFTNSGNFFNISQFADDEAAADDVQVFNNTVLGWLYEDADSNGQITSAEGNQANVGSIFLSGSNAYAYRNITAGKVTNELGAIGLENRTMDITDLSGVPSGYTDAFTATSRADYRPTTRAQVLALLTGSGVQSAVSTAKQGADYVWNFATNTAKTGLDAPTVESTLPADGAVYGPDGRVELRFDQPLRKATGNIYLRDTSGPTVVETFNIATGVGDDGGTVAILHNVITVQPGSNMPAGAYAIRADSGIVTGPYGEVWTGISDDTTLNFTVNASTPGAFIGTDVVAGDYWEKSSGFSGISGNKKNAVFAFRARADVVSAGTASERHTLFFAEDGSEDFGFWLGADSTMDMKFGSYTPSFPGGTTLSDVTTVLISIDTTQASAEDGLRVYVGGSRVLPTTGTWAQDDTIEPDQIIDMRVLGHPSLTRDFVGRLEFLYMDVLDDGDTLPDLDSVAVRDGFEPHLIGSDGSGPTGQQPMFYMTGGLSDWQGGTQLGYGGDGWTRGGNFNSVSAPTVSSPIADQSFATSALPETLDVSGNFTGTSITYSVNSVTGVSINSSTGVLTFADTMTEQTGTNITVTATNSGGSIGDTFSLDITAASGVTENIVDFAAGASVDMSSNGLSTTGTGFTIAFKVTIQETPAGARYFVAKGLDTYVSVDNAPRIGARVEDTSGTILLNDQNALTGIGVGDVLNCVFSANQSTAKLVIARKPSAGSFGSATLEASDTYTTANNLDVPQYVNNRTQSNTNNSGNSHFHGVWAANTYMDAETFYSSFFDGAGVMTAAMFNGTAVNSIDPDFHEAGNAAAWNALTDVDGTITDA